VNSLRAIRPILVVENEENDVFFIQHAMEKAGIPNPIQVVETGQDALDYLKGKGHFVDRLRYPLPAVVLLDLKLRGIDGTDVLQWIRHESPFPSLPVIVLSSSFLAMDVSKAYVCGANSYVVKPGNPSELAGIMRDFSQWWLKHNVPPF